MGPDIILRNNLAYACNPNTVDMEGGRSGVQGHSQLYSLLKV